MRSPRQRQKTSAAGTILLALALGAARAMAISPESIELMVNTPPSLESPLTKAHVCNLLLDPTAVYVPSGRTAAQDQEWFREKIRDLVKVSAEIGLSSGPYVLQDVTPQEMDALGAIPGHSLPTDFDGRKIVEGESHNDDEIESTILELAFPGGHHAPHWSIYRESQPPIVKLLIAVHVLTGHNVVYDASSISQARAADFMGAALKLAQHLEKLYRDPDVGYKKAALFVRNLTVLASQQDSHTGNYRTIDDLRDNAAAAPGKYVRDQKVVTPSPHGLQSAIANLPAYSEPWQVETALYFEEVWRYVAIVGPQKIIHEGLATVNMYEVPQFLKGLDGADLVTFAHLMLGVHTMRGNIANPYWIGVEGWRERLRVALNGKDLKSLPMPERKAFMREYAEKFRTEVLFGWRDIDFVYNTLTPDWVRRQEFFLARPATTAEQIPNLKMKKGDVQYIGLSRSPQRVLSWVGRSINGYLKFSDVWVADYHAFGRDVFAYKQRVFEGIPLHAGYAVRTLFHVADFLKRPASIDTIISRHDLNFPEGEKPAFVPDMPIRIEVSPNGAVSLHVLKSGFEGDVNTLAPIDEAAPEEAYSGFWQMLQTHLNAYKREMDLMFAEEVETKCLDPLSLCAIPELRAPSPALRASMDLDIRGLASPSAAHMGAAPMRARSVQVYKDTVQGLLFEKLQRVLLDDHPSTKDSAGVHLDVTERVPFFALDSRIHDTNTAHLPPAPIDHRTLGPQGRHPIDADDGAILLRGSILPGQVFVVPAKTQREINRQNGKPDKGEGEKEGEGQEGEDGEDGDKPGKPKKGKGGEGGKDKAPQEITISPATYGHLLAQIGIKFPRMRKKGGSDIKDKILMPRAYERHATTSPNWNRMMGDAVVMGIAAVMAEQGLASEDEVLALYSFDQLAEIGAGNIDPNRYVAREIVEQPQPDKKALFIPVIDMSGSMDPPRQRAVADALRNLHFALMAEYNNKVEWRTVGFSAEAQEFPFETAIHTTISGNTSYSSGLRLAVKIAQEGKYKNTNIYFVLIGDAGTGEADLAETMAIFRKDILPKNGYGGLAEYAGYIHTSLGGPADQQAAAFMAGMRQLKQEQSNKWFGIGEIAQPGGRHVLNALLNYLNKESRF